MSTEPTDAEHNYDDTWEHTEATKKISSVFANQLFVQPLGDRNLRVNFGEILDDEPRYHTAVVLSAVNAKSFAELIHRQAMSILAPPPPIVQTPVTPPAPTAAPVFVPQPPERYDG